MHVELCLDASQSFHNLAFISVDIYFRANVTNLAFTRILLKLDEPKKSQAYYFQSQQIHWQLLVGQYISSMFPLFLSSLLKFLYKFFPFPSF